ncbi:histidine kinase [Candidatus Chlorohelix sp.]|uniref:histidine kinase n=1 Tax=Candidatus Chlorohelix sp. TaxID=3139201 RepID=UPI0030468F7C
MPNSLDRDKNNIGNQLQVASIHSGIEEVYKQSSQGGAFPLRNSLGGRILAGFLAIAFMSLVVALVAILYTSQSGNSLSTQEELDQQVTDGVLRLELAVERQFNAARGVLLSLDSADTDKEFSEATQLYEAASVQLNKAFESLSLPRRSDSQTQELHDKFSTTISQIRTINLEDFKTTAIYTYERVAREQKNRLITAINKDLNLYREEIARKIRAAREQGTLITILSLALALMTTLGGTIVATLIIRSIMRPLRELATVADALHKDNYDVPVPQSNGNDEVVRLAGAMGRMAENLRISRNRLQSSLNETRRRNRELTAVNRVMASISASLDLDQVLNDAMEELISVSEMERCAVFLVSPDRQLLRLALHRAQSEQSLNIFNKGLKVGEYMTGQVAETGEIIYLNDNVLEDSRVPPDIQAQSSIRSYLGIPFTSSSGVVGVIAMTSDFPKNFTDNDIVLYKAIGSQIGIAVENAQLYSQAQLVAALEERNRLARDLHDSVTQTLFSITLTAESARAMLIKKPERVEAQLDRLQVMARGALAEMRTLIFQLRPVALEEQGLVTALQKHIESVKAKEYLNIEFDVFGERRLSNEHEQTLYRITQEALNNIMKHAQASRVLIKLTIDDRKAELLIHDNGIGFEPQEVVNGGSINQKSLGMTSMRERAELAGGTLQIESKPGEGSKIKVILPLLVAPRPVGLGIY